MRAPQPPSRGSPLPAFVLSLARPRREREGPGSWDGFGATQASSQVTLTAQVSEGPRLVEASASQDLGGGGPVVLAFLLHPPLGSWSYLFSLLSHPLPRGESVRCWVTQTLPRVGGGGGGLTSACSHCACIVGLPRPAAAHPPVGGLCWRPLPLVPLVGTTQYLMGKLGKRLRPLFLSPL